MLAPAPDRRPVFIAGIVIAAAAAALILLLWPRTGSIIITASGPGNKPLDQVEVFINGEKKCSSSPCTISGLKPDTYMLRARAPGYQPMADTAVAINAAQKAVHNLTLLRATGTGIKVIADGSGLKLYVDGREIGPLPQELKDMEPGDHVVKVAGSDRYDPWEKRITVEPEQMQTIGPLKLKVIKGLATIVPGEGADGARVLLVSGNDRRTLPRLPINLDIPTSKDHIILATRKGYQAFRQKIHFEDGQAEKSFEVRLTGIGAGEAAPPRGPAPRDITPSVKAPAPAPSGGSATLNINAIPVSNVILDGRPLGPTPKLGVRVSAGAHTVVFVSGTNRKVVSVIAAAGQTKLVTVRF